MTALSVLPALSKIPPRTSFCGECDAMAVVQVDSKPLCRQHAVESLNAAHQAAVEAVNRLIRGEL